MDEMSRGDIRTDAEVVEESLADPEAFAEIFIRHHNAIYGYLAARFGSDVASDLASTTFVVAFGRRQSFDRSYPSAKPWLFGIAINVAREFIRTRGAQKRRAKPMDSGRAMGFDDEIAWRAEAQELVRISGLVDAINALRPEDREILLLYAFGDLSYTEIAVACEIPVGTVRSRLSRTRKKLYAPLLDASSHGTGQ